MRCATSTKLRQEWERRLADNADAVFILKKNIALWEYVAGPPTESLLQPSTAALDAARRAGGFVEELAHHDQSELSSHATEILRAIAKLKEVSWPSIHKDKFWITPAGLYGELVRMAPSLINICSDSLGVESIRP